MTTEGPAAGVPVVSERSVSERSVSERGALARVLSTPAGVLGFVGCGIVALVGLVAPVLAPNEPFAIVAPPLDPPSARYLMGSDALGHDLFSQIVHGTRSSLFVLTIVAALVLCIGTTVGVIAGSSGQWLDDSIMRVAEVVQIIPRFFLALVVSSIFGAGLGRLALLLGLTGWPMLARIVRAETQSIVERDFVVAARSVGATRRRVLWREVVPNLLPTTFAYLGIVVAQSLLIEAGIGFLGLGDPNRVSWGQLAGEAQRYLRVAWWLPVFPGACIAFTVLSLNLLGDRIADVVMQRQ